MKLLERRMPLSEQAVQAAMGSDTPLSEAARVSVPAVDLRLYDALLEEASAASDSELSEVSNQGGESMSQDAMAALKRCLQELRLATVRTQYEAVMRQAMAESWSYAEFLLELVQRECQQRQHNRIERLLKASQLPLEKNWSSLDLKRLPTKVMQQLRGLLSGDFLDRRENVLVFGPPGSGKTHALSSRGAGTGAGRSVGCCSTKCSLLVQELLKAKRDLRAEGTAARAVAVGRLADRRPGLRAAEPGGDGGAVHAVGGALRAWQRAADEQPGVLAVGADLQGPDDDGGGDRPPGASQRDRGDECAELPGGAGQRSRSACTPAREGEPGEEARS